MNTKDPATCGLYFKNFHYRANDRVINEAGQNCQPLVLFEKVCCNDTLS